MKRRVKKMMTMMMMKMIQLKNPQKWQSITNKNRKKQRKLQRQL